MSAEGPEIVDDADRRRRGTDTQRFFSVSLDMLCIADAAGFFVELNPAWEATLGWTLDELKSRPMFEFLHPDDLERSIATRARIHAGDPALSFENRYRHRDGSWRWLLWKAARAPEGGLVYAAARDVTEIKEKERQLREALADSQRAQARILEQAALLDEARDAILTLDLEGHVTYWSRGAERLYGFSPAEAKGEHIATLVHGPDRGPFENARRATLAEGAWTGAMAQRSRADADIVVDSRWTLVRTPEGEPRAILQINTDVTERRKLEQQFLRSQHLESIGTLAGGVAHDLNNVLAPIVLGVEMLGRKVHDPAALRLLGTIGVAANRGAEIVKQVLGFARGVDGERVLLQPARLLTDVERIVREIFPRDIVVDTRVPEALPMIKGDATQLQQVLLNLCLNARDAMPRGGTLTVSADTVVVDRSYAQMSVEATEGTYVLVQVADTGEGMAPAVRDRIFDPFFTTKEVGKGTGLGLATSLAIVKSHGGFINVYSEPGRGARFQVYLPVPPGSGDTLLPVADTSAMPRGKGELILVVDDEAAILEITTDTLESFGYRVLTASDGTEAVARYAERREEIAVMLTDMTMPYMDGPATVRALKRIDPAVKVIGASGRGPDSPAEGVLDFLPKPYTAERLLRSLRRVIDGEA